MSTEYCAETVQPIVRDAVRRKLHLLSGASEDDLMQEAMRRVWRAWPNYDPAKGAVSTFVNRCVHCEMLDQMRKLGRQQVRDGRAKAMFEARVGTFTLDAQDMPDVSEGIDPSLPPAEWAGQVYRRAKHVVGSQKVRRGRKWYSRAQAVTCVLLMKKLKLSTRGMELLLKEREDVRRAMHLMRCPSHMVFFRFCNEFQMRGDEGVAA